MKCSMNGMAWTVWWSTVIVIINWNSFNKWCMNQYERVIEIHEIKKASRENANNHCLDRKIKWNLPKSALEDFIRQYGWKSCKAHTNQFWMKFEECAEKRNDTYTLTCRYGPSKHSSFSMIQTLLTLIHIYEDTHAYAWAQTLSSTLTHTNIHTTLAYAYTATAHTTYRMHTYTARLDICYHSSYVRAGEA